MADQALKAKIKKVIVEGLKLRRDPESIPESESLFGDGLHLDSIDILTLVTVLEDQFSIRIEDEEVQQLNSVDAIADFIRSKSDSSQ